MDRAHSGELADPVFPMTVTPETVKASRAKTLTFPRTDQ